MDPLTLAAIAGKALTAGGTLYAGIEQGRSLKASAKAKKREAEAVREEGLWDQIQFNEETRRLLSTQRALFGEAGVRLEGAPADLMVRTNTERVMERMQRAKNTAYEVSSLRLDARELEKSAKAAKTGGILGAFSSFF